MVVLDIFTLKPAMLKWGASGAVTLVCGATVQRLARGCWRQPIGRRRAFRGLFTGLKMTFTMCIARSKKHASGGRERFIFEIGSSIEIFSRVASLKMISALL